MEDYFVHVFDFVRKTTTTPPPTIIAHAFVDILISGVPIWAALFFGLLIGWSWRPRWTGFLFFGIRPKLRLFIPPGFGARRLWLAVSAFCVAGRLLSSFRLRKWKEKEEGEDNNKPPLSESTEFVRVNSETSRKEHDLVTENDVEHLVHLLDGKIGERAWQNLMERSTPSMAYQAWRYEPETGPVIYQSKTVFEDATPELVRDFFWDDEFRPKWDPMLSYFKMLEECHHTGTTIVHWIKKFPFFCSDREYIIGRRIWEGGKNYYCVTKAVPYLALPTHDKPRRVELYFSSWVIRPVQSRKGDGQWTACEVRLVHYEDMGIPKDVAKLGVRHGMWGTVKKLHTGFRAYQVIRKPEAPVSRSALVASITTKISFERTDDSSETLTGEEQKHADALAALRHRDKGRVDLKWLIIGGTVALACGFHTGVIGKTLLFGAGQRIARGRRVNC